MTVGAADGQPPPVTDDDVVVLVPAGEPILAAAAWVGTVCWAELRLHQMISDELGTAVVAPLAPAAGSSSEDEDEQVGDRSGDLGSFGQSSDASRLWTVRAHRAEVAEAWHRRLPELREFPRPDFVAPGSDGERLLVDGSVTATLQALLDHYRQRSTQPMGAADGPVADTLAVAIARTEADLVLLAEPS